MVRQPPGGLNRTALTIGALVALAAAIAVGALLLLPRLGDDSPRAERPVVMPGHGLVMPTAVLPRAANGELEILAGDYWFKPSATRLRAGAYRLRTRNYGVTVHDVMVERAPIKLTSPGTPSDEAAPFGVEALDPGVTKSTKVVLGPGRWEVFCSVGGHYEAGQHFELEVYGKLPRGMSEAGSSMGNST